MEQTEDDLPAPLTPADCDLRNFHYMALDVGKLRDSDTAALENPEAFRCAILLYCAAWHQVPAASLPDDESKLARLAGYGRDLEAFRHARETGGLKGWIRCTDGRLYHPVVAAKANEAFISKRKQQQRTAAANAARARKGMGQPRSIPPTAPETNVTSNVTDDVTVDVTSNVTDDVTSTKGKDKIGEDNDSELRSAALASPGACQSRARKPANTMRSAGAPGLPLGARDELWALGVPTLRNLTGKPEGAARAFLGKMLKNLGDDAAAALAILREAESLRPIDPAAWVSAAAKARSQAERPQLGTIRTGDGRVLTAAELRECST